MSKNYFDDEYSVNRNRRNSRPSSDRYSRRDYNRNSRRNYNNSFYENSSNDRYEVDYDNIEYDESADYIEDIDYDPDYDYSPDAYYDYEYEEEYYNDMNNRDSRDNSQRNKTSNKRSANKADNKAANKSSRRSSSRSIPDDDYYYDEDISPRKRKNSSKKASSGKKGSKGKKKKKKKGLKVLGFIVSIIVILTLVIMFVPGAKDRFKRMVVGCGITKAYLSGKYKDDWDKNVYTETKGTIITSDCDLSGYTNIVLFGLDSRNGELESDTHTDTIMIASINNKSGDVKLTSVYRDTLMKMDDSNGDETYNKCNTAFFYNGPVGAINMLNENLDLNIENYVTVNFSGLASIIDSLGGLDLEISEEELPLVNGYLTETREVTGKDAPDLTHAGKVHMSGLQATAYCRIRYVAFTDPDTDETYRDDYGRTARQRYVMRHLLQVAKSAGLNKMLDCADTVISENNVDGEKIISTNMKWDKVYDLLEIVVTCELKDQTGYPTYNSGSNTGYYPSAVIPQGVAYNVAILHENFFPKKNYTPSSNVYAIDEYIKNYTGVYEP